MKDKKMKAEVIFKIFEDICEKLDEIDFKFYDENNREDFLDVREGAIIALDELKEIIERDQALEDAMSAEDED